jgi:hypothetical protein
VDELLATGFITLLGGAGAAWPLAGTDRRGRRVPNARPLRRLIVEREKPADLLVQAPNKYALVLPQMGPKVPRSNGTQRRGVPWDWNGQ